MPKRVTGAALYACVISHLREMLADDYGLPMQEYTSKMEEPYSIGSDMQPILEVTFTHRRTNAVISVTNIHPNDDGTIGQYGSSMLTW